VECSDIELHSRCKLKMAVPGLMHPLSVLCSFPGCAAGGYRDILLLQPRVNAVVSLLSDPHLAHIHCWENKMERWEELSQARRQLALEGTPGQRARGRSRAH